MDYPKIAEYRQVRANAWPTSQEATLDSVFRPDWRTDVRLVARKAGYSCAGSAMRWDNDAFGTIWEDCSSGCRFGSWFKTEQEARDAFAKHQARAVEQVANG